MTSLVIEDTVRAKGARVDNGWVCVEWKMTGRFAFPSAKAAA